MPSDVDWASARDGDTATPGGPEGLIGDDVDKVASLKVPRRYRRRRKQRSSASPARRGQQNAYQRMIQFRPAPVLQNWRTLHVQMAGRSVEASHRRVQPLIHVLRHDLSQHPMANSEDRIAMRTALQQKTTDSVKVRSSWRDRCSRANQPPLHRAALPES